MPVIISKKLASKFFCNLPLSIYIRLLESSIGVKMSMFIPLNNYIMDWFVIVNPIPKIGDKILSTGCCMFTVPPKFGVHPIKKLTRFFVKRWYYLMPIIPIDLNLTYSF